MYKLCMFMHKGRIYKKLVDSLTLETIFLLHTIFQFDVLKPPTCLIFHLKKQKLIKKFNLKKFKNHVLSIKFPTLGHFFSFLA